MEKYNEIIHNLRTYYLLNNKLSAEYVDYEHGEKIRPENFAGNFSEVFTKKLNGILV